MKQFQSTLPARGATSFGTADVTDTEKFQSTLPARGATGLSQNVKPEQIISIHAPRTGSDFAGWLVMGVLAISIHAPRTGSD